MTIEIKQQGVTVRAAGASSALLNAKLDAERATRKRQRMQHHGSPDAETQAQRDEERALDLLSELADAEDRCQQCLTDLLALAPEWNGWTNCCCPDHAEPDVVREFEVWKAGVE